MLMPAHSFVNTALILLNHVIRYAALPQNLERKPKSPYLCTVFFIVLDLRLTKDWLSGIDSLFMPVSQLQTEEIKTTNIGYPAGFSSPVPLRYHLRINAR